MPTPFNNDTQELLNLIGEDAFTRLCAVFSGVRLHISNSEKCRQRLRIIVGEEKAGEIIFHYQGTALTLPMLSSLEIKRRNLDIIEDHKSGMSQREIALKYDLTDRQVRRIIADA
jgi:Mor family transcriptional regulator